MSGYLTAIALFYVGFQVFLAVSIAIKYALVMNRTVPAGRRIGLGVVKVTSSAALLRVSHMRERPFQARPRFRDAAHRPASYRGGSI